MCPLCAPVATPVCISSGTYRQSQTFYQQLFEKPSREFNVSPHLSRGKENPAVFAAGGSCSTVVRNVKVFLLHRLQPKSFHSMFLSHIVQEMAQHLPSYSGGEVGGTDLRWMEYNHAIEQGKDLERVVILSFHGASSFLSGSFSVLFQSLLFYNFFIFTIR